ncbi:hypothetical protein NOVOSPHI9U_370071 [Novosphingobium sp. 9U]|nr:hypothetical protein NOVOSPHI9U_370071 [Novosphingobium sp. 9U]
MRRDVGKEAKDDLLLTRASAGQIELYLSLSLSSPYQTSFIAVA